MQIEEDVRILVYNVTNSAFENIGEINQFDSLMWPVQYSGYSQFQLTAPITDENKEYLKEGHILWKVGGTTAVIIEIIKTSTDENGLQTFEVKGRTLECLLTKRIVWSTYFTSSDTVQNIMQNLVLTNCINPSDEDRKLPYLSMIPYLEEEANKITYQKTGGTVYDALYELAQESELGFEIQFHPDLEALLFRVYKGVDRTSSQDKVDSVIFSRDTDDILSSTYNKNVSSNINTALVAGEGEGSDRKHITIVNTVSDEAGHLVLPKGLLRNELYVDARDVQSSYSDDSGETVTLSQEDYLKALSQRGNEKIAENSIVESFDCKLRINGAQFIFGKDYFLGDVITIVDNILGVQVNARITAVEDDFVEDQDHQRVFTFGYGYPSLLQKIKSVVS